MISKFFSRSSPINYLSLAVVFITFFVWSFVREYTSIQLTSLSYIVYVERFIYLLTLSFAMVISYFIFKNNKLDEYNSYSTLINILFLITFSEVFHEYDLVLSYIFVLLSAWNIVSSDSFFLSKERIFNASLCIFVAAIFNFWAILFIAVIFLSILINLQQEYRRLLIPFIAFFVVAVFFFTIAIFVDEHWYDTVQQMMYYNVDYFYFDLPIQMFLFGFFLIVAALTALSLLFNIIDLSKKIKESYVKVVAYFIVALFVCLMSVDKTTSLLIYAFFPVSVMATRFVETLPKNWAKDIFLFLLIIVALVAFSSFYWKEYQYLEIDYDYLQLYTLKTDYGF